MGILSDHRIVRIEFRQDEVFGSNDKIHNNITQLKPNDPTDVENMLLEHISCYKEINFSDK